jgi:hypothetical protein
VPDLFLVGLAELPASDLPHFSYAQRLLTERMTTIVAHFRAQVVSFIFGGRNTGQNAEGKRKERRGTLLKVTG